MPPENKELDTNKELETIKDKEPIKKEKESYSETLWLTGC